MRKVVVYYRDIFDNYEEEYMAGPYLGTDALNVQENLKLMGCKDFRIEPYVEKRAA